MILTLTKVTITQVVDALRALTDREEAINFVEWAEKEFDPLEPNRRAETIDHLLGIAEYATSLARSLIDRERP